MSSRRTAGRARVLIVAIAALSPVVFGAGVASAGGDYPASPDTEMMEQQLVDKLNAARMKDGLEPLAVYWDLTDDARSHSQYMLESGEFHHNPDLRSVTTGWYALGENIAIHYDVAGMHEAWMASPGHRANILGNYNYVGVGVAVNDAGSIWGTQVFMRGPAGLADPYAPEPKPELAPSSVFDFESKSRLKELIQHHREELGLEPLAWQSDLFAIAEEHAIRSATKGEVLPVDHADGVVAITALADGGVGGWFAAWGESEQGRAILGGDFTHFAVAVAHPGDVPSAKYVTILVDDFAPSASGVPDEFTGKDPVEHVCPEGKECDSIGVVDDGGKFKLNDDATSGHDAAGFYFGNPGDIPLMGDWDCDGVRTPGQYRARDGYVYLRNSNTPGIGEIRFYFGNPGDVPLVGDFNGDGCDTVGIHRPGTGEMFIINELGENDGGLGAAQLSYYFGDPGDKAFAGDFDGDGIDTVGLHRESTGLVYFVNEHRSRAADEKFIFGDPGDILLAGDWDGDGVDTPALYRPSNGMLYLKLANSAGVADEQVYVGRALVAAVRSSR